LGVAVGGSHPDPLSFLFLVFFFLKKKLIKKMTCGRGNMGIFRHIGHFSKLLVVRRAGVGMLAVCEAKRKTDGNLES
jgi:hypothetical protein